MSDRVGQQVGNYRLERLLGSGGFADVYLGKQVFLDSPAAIKLLHTNLAQGDIESFRSEAVTLVRLIHPHIVRILDFGLEGNTPFLVMDYAPNGTLRQRYQRGTQLPLATVVDNVQQISSALQYAHDQKIIHRDIKPENMLLGRNNEILLSDFGIAVVAQSTRTQLTQEMTGTIAYMAPEQIQAHPRPASDQYSLGIVVYEWLAGYPPFGGSFTEIAVKHMMVQPASLREKMPMLTPDVEQVVLTALAKDPLQRFSSIRAFATALEQASKGVKVAMPTPAQLSQMPTLHPSPVTPILPLIPPEPGAAKMPAERPAAQQMDGPTMMNTLAAQQPLVLSADAHAPHAQTAITPPNQHYNPVTAPPQVPLQRRPEPESARKGMSRRAVLIAGVSVVGVAAIGGTAFILASHNPPTGTTTGGTHPTSSPTSHTTTTTTTVNPNILARDTFQRPDQMDWGTASDGEMWGGDALNSADLSIHNHMGQAHRTANGNSLYTATLGAPHTDAEVVATAMLDSFNKSHIGVMLRYQNDNHYYKAYIDGNSLLILNRIDAANGPQLAKLPFSAQPNTLYPIRFQVIGTTLQAKAWQANTPEPAHWMVTANANTSSMGQGGMRPQINQGVTLSVTAFQENKL